MAFSLEAEGLEPGLYLVGREDGAVEPFNVEVLDDGNLCHSSDPDMVDHAVAHAGWWWRRIGIPNALPANLDDYPDAVDEWDQYR